MLSDQEASTGRRVSSLGGGDQASRLWELGEVRGAPVVSWHQVVVWNVAVLGSLPVAIHLAGSVKLSEVGIAVWTRVLCNDWGGVALALEDVEALDVRLHQVGPVDLVLAAWVERLGSQSAFPAGLAEAVVAVAGVEERCGSNVLVVAETRGLLGSFLSLGKNREEDGGENSDDCDNNQQLN